MNMQHMGMKLVHIPYSNKHYSTHNMHACGMFHRCILTEEQIQGMNNKN